MMPRGGPTRHGPNRAAPLGCPAMRPPLRITSDEAPPGALVRFTLELEGIALPAFAVRTPGGWRAYVDRCRHLPMTLDPGLDGIARDGGRVLVCTRHDAHYDAASGLCTEGPCEGRSLTALALESRADGLWCLGRDAPPR